MKVVGNQCLGKAGGLGFRKDISKSIYKVIAIGIICKYFFTVDALGDYMVKGIRCIYS